MHTVNFVIKIVLLTYLGDACWKIPNDVQEINERNKMMLTSLNRILDIGIAENRPEMLN